MEECERLEAGFGELLMSRHPTKGFEHRGKFIPHHRYSLCWGGFEPDYRPASAEQLAAARAERQAKAVEKEAAPLFAGLIREEGYVTQQRER